MVEVNVTLSPIDIAVTGAEPGVTLTIGGGIGPAAVYNTALTQLVGVNPIAAGKNIAISTTSGSYTISASDPPVLMVQGRTGNVVITLQDVSAANAAHAHIIGDITGLQTTLDNKQPAGSYAGSTHTHAIADVSGLTAALAAKASTAHSHVIADVTGLQTALDAKQASGTYATLVNGLVPSAQLPSYVDDVLEYSAQSGFPATGETGKIYVATSTNKAYRWSGSAYVEIVPSPGTTDALTEGSTNLYFTANRALSAVQSALDGKAATSHTHTVSAVTGLQSLLDAKAAVSHTHAIADVSGLQSAINLATTLTAAPTTNTASGSVGQLAVDSTYLYACVASNTWKRVELVSYGTAVGGIVITVQPTSTTITAGNGSASLSVASTLQSSSNPTDSGNCASFFNNGELIYAMSRKYANGFYIKVGSQAWAGPYSTNSGNGTLTNAATSDAWEYTYEGNQWTPVYQSMPYRHVAGNSSVTVAAKSIFRSIEVTPNVIKTSLTTESAAVVAASSPTSLNNQWTSHPFGNLGTVYGVIGVSKLAAKSNMVVAALMTGYENQSGYGGSQPTYVRTSDPVPLAYTLNGASWSAVTFPEYTAIHDIIYENGRFVAIATGGRGWYSTTGLSWTGTSLPSGEWISMAAGNGKIVAVGVNAGAQTNGGVFQPYELNLSAGATQSVATSSDNGSTWTLRSGVLPTIETWQKVVFIGGSVNRFFAFPSNNQFAAVSPDGIVWDVVFTPSNRSFFGQHATAGDDLYIPNAWSQNPASYKITAALSTSGGSGSASFSCSATTESGSLTYRWQRSTDGGTTWSDISGATGSTLTLNDQQTSNSGTKVRCAVSNGTATTYTASATLTVNA
jgi:hypothetical protein